MDGIKLLDVPRGVLRIDKAEMALAKLFEPDPGQAGVGMELLPADYRDAPPLVSY